MLEVVGAEEEEEVVLAAEVVMEEEEVGVEVLVVEEEEVVEVEVEVKVEEKEIGSAPMKNVGTITFHGEITATDVMPLDQEEVGEEMMMVSVGDGEE